MNECPDKVCYKQENNPAEKECADRKKTDVEKNKIEKPEDVCQND
jgi:hypothetical protein